MKKAIYLIGSLFLLSGCVSQHTPLLQPVTPQPKVVEEPEPVITPVKPKKVHKLKEVQDDNFTPEYMYPTNVKKPKTTQTTAEPVDLSTTNNPSVQSMSKATCIEMIGQEKFDKYTAMLGGESGAIKRCMMLKSMQ